MATACQRLAAHPYIPPPHRANIAMGAGQSSTSPSTWRDLTANATLPPPPPPPPPVVNHEGAPVAWDHVAVRHTAHELEALLKPFRFFNGNRGVYKLTDKPALTKTLEGEYFAIPFHIDHEMPMIIALKWQSKHLNKAPPTTRDPIAFRQRSVVGQKSSWQICKPKTAPPHASNDRL